MFALLVAVLLRTGPDSLVYAVLPASRFEAQVGKSGVFSFAGHEHRIRARAFQGRVVYWPSEPRRSRIDIVIESQSLEVLTPDDTAERRQVTEVMRRDVLAVDENPEIRFRSQSVTRTSDGYRIAGVFTLRGTTRPVTVDVTTQQLTDTLLVNGAFAVKQTDYGIKPVRAGGGTVRVKDEVPITFSIVAVRRQGT
ncbi:MAG TPA: YceI family protein [Gemmatimonadales bacterium]|nr:YceI family protein [Gemmatimonadales bacterium]